MASHASRYRRPGGPWDLPSLDSLLSTSSRSHSIVDGAGRLGAAEIEHRVAALAGWLLSLGARRHDVVAFQLPNGVDAALLYRACWRIGAVAAPVHHRAGIQEIEAVLSQLPPVIFISSPGMAAADLAPGAVTSHVVSAAIRDDPRAHGPAVNLHASPARPGDLAVVLFTSGSTGPPKAVLHTHRALAYKATTMVLAHGLRPDDATLMPAPLAHISGLLNGVLLPCVAGMRSVLMERWDPEKALALIDSHHVTFMAGPPTFFVTMASARSSTRRPGLAGGTMRLISTGGAAVTPAFVDATTEAFGCRVKRTYGSTEAPTVATTSPADPPEQARATDGRVVGEAELKVVDPMTLTKAGAGRPGELWVRGPELFAGYADADDTTAAIASPGRWFRTGDLAVITDDGCLTITGRIKEIIIRGGENVSMREVEEVLESHPTVQQAACAGVPDPVLGERVGAVVVASAAFDVDECKRWFASRGVARFKVPDLIVTTRRIPLLAAGKIDRGAVRELLSAGWRSPR